MSTYSLQKEHMGAGIEIREQSAALESNGSSRLLLERSAREWGRRSEEDRRCRYSEVNNYGDRNKHDLSRNLEFQSRHRCDNST